MKKRDIYKDFDIFTRSLIATKDVDPIYPTINTLIKSYDFEPLWFAFCYVGFYHLGSGIKMCSVFPEARHWNRERFLHWKFEDSTKFGHERRGTIRNPQAQADMFDDIASKIQMNKQSVLNWTNNKTFRKSITGIKHHGEWAAFKIAEIMEKSFDYSELAISDLGLDGRDPNRDDSPIGGLRWLYGRDNEYDKDWFPLWNRFGSSLAEAYKVDIGVIETCLCKFHKFMTGNYYIGHDIHELYDLKEQIMEHRYSQVIRYNFNSNLVKQSDGVNRQLKGLYQRTGFILNAKYGDSIDKVNVLDILMNTE